MIGEGRIAAKDHAHDEAPSGSRPTMVPIIPSLRAKRSNPSCRGWIASSFYSSQ
jgi:hypothetical protein